MERLFKIDVVWMRDFYMIVCTNTLADLWVNTHPPGTIYPKQVTK